MEAEYSREYRGLYQKHWWWRAREEAVVDILRRNRPQGGFGRILDVGCGDGLLFDRLRDFGEVEGVEPDPLTLSIGSPHRSRIYVCPFNEVFQPGKDYGLILMLDVLEHLSDAAAAVRKAESLLTPGGIFLAAAPAFQLLWTGHDVINHHVRRYRNKALRDLIEGSGLQICSERYWFQWLFPVKLIARTLENVFRTQPKNPGIPPTLLNRSLYLFSRLEYAILGRLPVPFGSSIMVLAQKSAACGPTSEDNELLATSGAEGESPR